MVEEIQGSVHRGGCGGSGRGMVISSIYFPWVVSHKDSMDLDPVSTCDVGSFVCCGRFQEVIQDECCFGVTLTKKKKIVLHIVK